MKTRQRCLRSRLAALAVTALLAGCGQSMWEQRKLTTFAPDPAFDDGASARPLVAGVVEREQQVGARPETMPVPLTAAWLRRGQERFHVYCEVCHGPLGDGRGIVPQYGFPNPPAYTDPRLMRASDGELFDVVTHGKDKMYAYRDRVSRTDRWAIVAYIRALQLSQHATPADLPPGVELPGSSP